MVIGDMASYVGNVGNVPLSTVLLYSVLLAGFGFSRNDPVTVMEEPNNERGTMKN